MKIRSSIAALAAVLSTALVAVPALAHDGHEHEASIFDRAGTQLDWVAIGVTVVIVAAIVLLLAGWVSSLFKKD